MDKKKNYAQSVKQKLMNLARTRNDDFQLILTKYALERFLARLALSEHRTEFILKGAMLFQIWTGFSSRATRDLDFLSFGSSGVEDLTLIVRNICTIEIQYDGISFNLEGIKGERIKVDQDYEGVRVQVPAFLERTRIPLRVDVGFGDVVNPEIREDAFPTLLGFPEPSIRTYPPETVVAEKLQALVDLGMTNSRLKDFYDLYVLTQKFQPSSKTLAHAISATFERRKTAIPAEMPIALTKEFSDEASKQLQWKSFLRKSNVSDDISLERAVSHLNKFFGTLFDI